MSKEDCLQARQTCDDNSAFSPEQLLAAENHLRSCEDCEAWRNQWNEIAATAKAMPTFDVPEALTQRIMFEVREEETGKAIIARNIVLSFAVLVPAMMMGWFEFADTAGGIVGWVVGLIFLAGLKQLVEINTNYETQLQK